MLSEKLHKFLRPTERELKYWNDLFLKHCEANQSLVPPLICRELFFKSGITKKKLKTIYAKVKIDDKVQGLTRREFFLALKLISLVQVDFFVIRICYSYCVCFAICCNIGLC